MIKPRDRFHVRFEHFVLQSRPSSQQALSLRRRFAPFFIPASSRVIILSFSRRCVMRRSGLTLIEVVVAIMLIVVIVGVILALIPKQRVDHGTSLATKTNLKQC